MSYKKLLPLLCLSSTSLMGVTVSNATQLDNALRNISADQTIDVNANISINTLVTPVLFPVNSNLNFTPNVQTTTISSLGGPFTISGGGVDRGFFVLSGDVTFNDLIFNQMRARGGNGGNGAGGGAGLGGALFVFQNAVVTLNNCQITSSSALGGTGGGPVGGSQGGGGGMQGNGGLNNEGGGGGFAGNGANNNGGGGGAQGNAPGTTGGGDFSGAVGAPPGANGASGQGGGGGVGAGNGGNGGFGGGGGGAKPIITAGNGGFGGGGGGAQNGTAGDGGFGGGGGASSVVNNGGDGGFGGGGGRRSGIGGFGGGNGGGGAAAPGGGGAGFGGAIFLQAPNNGSAGAQLTLTGTFALPGNTATGGAASVGATPGQGLGQAIFMMSGSELIFNLAQNFSMPSPIAGNQGRILSNTIPTGSTVNGGLTKQGPQLLTLVGANTYTGTTTVEGGELRLDGSVVSDVVVNPGATFSGFATVSQDISGLNGGTLTNNGIVSPGDGGIGQMSVQTSYTQGASGTLVVDVTPTGNVSDKFMITSGSATLAGTLQVLLGPGNYIFGTTYDIIFSNGTIGQFDFIIDIGPASPFVQFGITYGNVVTLTILNQLLFEFQNVAPGIPRAVADCFLCCEPIIPGSDFGNITEVLGTLSDPELNRALYSLSPIGYGTLEWQNARQNSQIANIISDHTWQLCCSPRLCCVCPDNQDVWISVFGSWGQNGSYGNLPKFKSDDVGVLLGYDYGFCSSIFAGAGVGYFYSDIDWRGLRGGGHSHSFFGTLYGSYQGECLIVDLAFIGGGSDYKMRRHLKFGTINRTAWDDFWGYFATTHLRVAAPFDVCAFSLIPFGTVDYHYFHRNGFSEHGANSIDLKVHGKNQHFMRGEIGGIIAYNGSGCYSCWSPYVGASWVREFPLNTSKEKASFKGRSCVIDIKAYDHHEDFVAPIAGIKFTNCCGFSATLGYRGLYGSGTQRNELEGSVDISF